MTYLLFSCKESPLNSTGAIARAQGELEVSVDLLRARIFEGNLREDLREDKYERVVSTRNKTSYATISTLRPSCD